MDKASNHPFAGHTIYLGTKHGKDKALAPYFESIQMRCEAVIIDTDVFGTFSGEIERKGTAKDVLRTKIRATIDAKPDGRFFLASEGSFFPYPLFPLIPHNHEALLFYDRESDLEIFVEEKTTETNHDQIKFTPQDDLQAFLDKVKFPSHAVIVQSVASSPVYFKGLQKLFDVQKAILEAFLLSTKGQILISTDMRACFNPTRMRTIAKTGEALLQRLTSFCPQCKTIGFAKIRSEFGLECFDCGRPTNMAKHHIWGCLRCDFEKIQPRQHRETFADPSTCNWCNP